MNYDIFISYKRLGASSATAAYLYEILQQKGYNVWRSRGLPQHNAIWVICTGTAWGSRGITGKLSNCMSKRRKKGFPPPSIALDACMSRAAVSGRTLTRRWNGT